MSNTSYNVGDKVQNAHPFTTPTGVHFPANTTFVVNLVGRSIRCHEQTTGTIVWISDGRFLSP